MTASASASASAQLRHWRVLLTLLLVPALLNNLFCPATASPPVCDAVVDPDTGEFRDSSNEDCTPNPCLRPLNPCGRGECTYDASGGSSHSYICDCPPSTTAPGSFVDGAPTCTTGGAAGSRTHTVKQGDQCLSIATSYGLILPGLKALNPDLNCSSLSVGQILDLGNYIPNGRCRTLYTVLADETCLILQTAVGMSTDEFFDLNGGTCNALRKGSQVCVAGKTSVGKLATGTITFVSCGAVAATSGETCKTFDRHLRAADKGKPMLLEMWNRPSLKCPRMTPKQLYCTRQPTKPPVPRKRLEWLHFIEAGVVGLLGAGEGLFEDGVGLVEDDEVELFGDGGGLAEDGGETIIMEEGTVCDVAYAARQGDTCESIRSGFNISEEEFRRINPRLSCLLLQIGGKVCLQAPPGDVGAMNFI